jgi:putative hydrolase of the HAD superfamily
MKVAPIGPQIRAVSFDVGGTLIESWPSVGHIYAEVAARHGCKGLSVETLNRQFTAAWRKARGFRYSRAEWAGIVHATFSGLTQVTPSQTFFEELYRRFSEPEAWHVFDDVVPAFEALASRGVRLGVISNWDDRLPPLLRRLKLHDYFEAVAVSCAVGAAKPAPVIFEYAARKLGVAPEAILHVGDSLEMDVQGARSAGFQALLLQRGATASVPNTINSLQALRDGNA